IYSHLLGHSVEDPQTVEQYVKMEEFDQQCLRERRTFRAHEDLETAEDSYNSDSDDESIQPKLDKFEAHYYYGGVGRRGHLSPDSIGQNSYCTSKHKFVEPTGPYTYHHRTSALVVPESHEFAQDGMWDRVCDKVVELLDKRNIKFTSVDFIRFTSIPESKGHTGEVVYDTNPTIWIGVIPNTLNAALAQESATDILAYLDDLKVQNIEVDYRKSIAKFLGSNGPPLFHPVEDEDVLKPVIDNVSVTLGIPITGRRNSMQGTLGPYFQVGDKLYAITTRHNLFSPNEGNEEYRHSDSGPKRDVLVMGDRMFQTYLRSIRDLMVSPILMVQNYQANVSRFTTEVETGVGLPQSRNDLERAEKDLIKAHEKLHRIKEFYTDMVKYWSPRKNRIIGFVVWSPSLGPSAPHHYTHDLCATFSVLVCTLINSRMRFNGLNQHAHFPEPEAAFHRSGSCRPLGYYTGFHGLVALKGILTIYQLNEPTTAKRLSFDPESELPPRRVFKRGAKTNTTFGTLSRYMSHVCKYSPLGATIDSLKLPIINFEEEGHPGYGSYFCEGGDSGLAVVTLKGKFAGLLNGGTSMGFRQCDIGYATPFEWVWEQVLKEFPNADMDFDNLYEPPPRFPLWLSASCEIAREKSG
ncbi:hypothetical protein BJ165DRAFT_1342937, partial [Panaeolus papilionaceus]